MTAVTVQEFYSLPNSQGEQSFSSTGPDVVTTVTAPSTVTTVSATRFVIVTADADCRMMIGTPAAVASGIPILSAIPNSFYTEAGSTQALKFI